jgi:hypothetical protein
MTERQDVRPLATDDLAVDDRGLGPTGRFDETIDSGPIDTGTVHRDETIAPQAEAYDEPTRSEEKAPPQPVERTPDETTDVEGAPLFATDEIDRFRTEWRALQADFVDSPREAVQHADDLVTQVIQSLATTVSDHKQALEGQWNQGEQVDTEELRITLRRYRSFLDQLLTV